MAVADTVDTQPEAQASTSSPSSSSTPAPKSDANNSAVIAEKMAIAAEHKAKGNEAFKAGDLQGAMRGWHSAILYLKGLGSSIASAMGNNDASLADPSVTPTPSAVDLDLSNIYSNMAAVHLKKQSWSRAIECCDQALEKNKGNVKASFRKATALNSRGDVKKAYAILETLDPADGSVKALKKQMDAEEAARSQKADATFRGMFAKSA